MELYKSPNDIAPNSILWEADEKSLPPILGLASKMRTFPLACLSLYAVKRPAGPAPTIVMFGFFEVNWAPLSSKIIFHKLA